MAVKMWTENEFRARLKEVLTPELCQEFVSQAIGNVGAFQDYDFFDADEFLSIFIDGRNSAETAKNARKVIEGFRDGVDLDDDSTDGADIRADYFAWSEYGDYIQSTNNPANYIYENALFDIIDYIVDNLEEESWFPDEIIEVINEYRANGGDI